jgi:hypothetical protein
MIFGGLGWQCLGFYREEFELVKRDDGTWLVDGHYSLHDFDLL